MARGKRGWRGEGDRKGKRGIEVGLKNNGEVASHTWHKGEGLGKWEVLQGCRTCAKVTGRKVVGLPTTR